MEWTSLHEKVLRKTTKLMKRDAEIRSLANQDFKISDFSLERVIGHGRFGRVWFAKHVNTNFYVAIKVIDSELIKKSNLSHEIFIEAFIHLKLSHPNIIQLYGYFIDSKSIYFVQEYAYNGSLYSKMKRQKFKRFSEYLAAKYIFQTAKALIECHRIGFFHGDVKPENILLDKNDDAKLCDFGLSWPNYCGSVRGLCGTKDYLPPEVLKYENYDHSIDIWGLGVLCFELLCGRSPFYSKKKEVTIRRILNVDFKFPKIIEEDAQDLINNLLTKNPNERLPLDKVISHKWIIKHYSV